MGRLLSEGLRLFFELVVHVICALLNAVMNMMKNQ